MLAGFEADGTESLLTIFSPFVYGCYNGCIMSYLNTSAVVTGFPAQSRGLGEQHYCDKMEKKRFGDLRNVPLSPPHTHT